MTNNFVGLVLVSIFWRWNLTASKIPPNFAHLSVLNDTSRFMQFRSALHQPTRTFLIQHKTALSPLQQAQILDDIRKNQQIYYEPTAIPSSAATWTTSPLGQPQHKGRFYEQSQTFLDRPLPRFGSYFSTPNTNYVDGMTPPPASSISTYAPKSLNYYTSIRPPPLPDGSNDFYRVDDLAAGELSTPLSATISNYTPARRGFEDFQWTTTTPPALTSIQYAQTSVQYPKTVEYPKNAVHGQSYKAKSPSAHFLPAANNEIIKEIYLETNPQELIARDRQKFFQSLLSGDQDVAQTNNNGMRILFDKGLHGKRNNETFSQPTFKTIVVEQTSKSAPVSNILEELTKNVIPPGTDFEIIRRTKDGKLEQVSTPELAQKKVTYVILEEQSDGRVKVQGVQNDGGGGGGEEVESIIKEIEKGEIKLPSFKSSTTSETETAAPSYAKQYEKSIPNKKNNYHQYKKVVDSAKRREQATFAPTPLQPDDEDDDGESASTSEFPTFLPTTTAYAKTEFQSTEEHFRPTAFSTAVPSLPPVPRKNHGVRKSQDVRMASSSQDTPIVKSISLSDIIRKEGFHAMARFLKQSGLDGILNDTTGPFTLFIPTDKAFRTLLIQLGGPDKAEEKFRENPRLLSGLLLHHVIPGEFRYTTLRDEMTGVSLAGTQLRVNTYTTHDIEWNDIKIVTINGARILDEKDILLPQGVAHAVDRVMFPLPVGNLLQSLQADRENRYSNFLKIVEVADSSPLLTGSKTFTLFAPLNRAFTEIEFDKIVNDENMARSFVMKHLVSGTLYSSGMKYYQVRDSLDEKEQITIYKEAGRIKVNTAHVVTRNIPATNGVVHAIDSLIY